jgi:hypothetical protein
MVEGSYNHTGYRNMGLETQEYSFMTISMEFPGFLRDPMTIRRLFFKPV